ncbi:hypothetical protein GCM10010360_24880 [Streptomyces nogalater]
MRAGRTQQAITFQLWHWRDDGEPYGLEHFLLLPAGPAAPAGEWCAASRGARFRSIGLFSLTID